MYPDRRSLANVGGLKQAYRQETARVSSVKAVDHVLETETRRAGRFKDRVENPVCEPFARLLAKCHWLRPHNKKKKQARRTFRHKEVITNIRNRQRNPPQRVTSNYQERWSRLLQTGFSIETARVRRPAETRSLTATVFACH